MVPTVTSCECIVPPCGEFGPMRVPASDCARSASSLLSKCLPDPVMPVDLRTSIIILESNDKKILYYSKAIISCSVCAITGECAIDFLINYAITYISALG